MARGGLYLGHAIAQKVALMTLGASRDPLSTLTPREREVLSLLGQGKSLAEASAGAKIGCRTTANLVATPKAKLDTATTPALIKLPVEQQRRLGPWRSI